MRNEKTQKIEAVVLHGVDVLEEGIAPSMAVMSEDSGGGKPAPGPTEPDTLPG